MNVIGFSNSKKIQKFLNTNKNWFQILNGGDLCVSSPEKSGNKITQQLCAKADNLLWRIVKDGDFSYLVSKNGFSLNNLGGIKVEGHNIFGTEFNKDNSEEWIIKKIENLKDKVQIINVITKMCLSSEGYVQVNSIHKLRNCNKHNLNQLFEIKPIKFE